MYVARSEFWSLPQPTTSSFTPFVARIFFIAAELGSAVVIAPLKGLVSSNRPMSFTPCLSLYRGSRQVDATSSNGASSSNKSAPYFT